jgi:hypothetical protein
MNGDLNDIKLTDLIQMVCHRQGKRVLLSLQNGDASGGIYIDDGDVIHAVVGSVVGESAVYRLLSWQSGTFRVSHYEQPPRRSVTLSWAHLMMEGSRMLNEKSRPVTGNETSQDHPGQDHSSQDHAESKSAVPLRESIRHTSDMSLESDFVELFLKLEQLRAQVEAKRTQKQPEVALRCLAEMVNAIIGCCQKWLDLNIAGNTLDAALDQIAQDAPQIHRLRVENGFLSIQSISDLFANRKGDGTTQQRFQQINDGLLNLMKGYLKQLTARYYTPDRQGQWEEISSTLLSDLAVRVKEIHF